MLHLHHLLHYLHPQVRRIVSELVFSNEAAAAADPKRTVASPKAERAAAKAEGVAAKGSRKVVYNTNAVNHSLPQPYPGMPGRFRRILMTTVFTTWLLRIKFIKLI